MYLAVGGEQVFASHAAPPDTGCYGGCGIVAVLGRAYRDAEEALRCSLTEFPGEVQVAGSVATVPGVG